MDETNDLVQDTPDTLLKRRGESSPEHAAKRTCIDENDSMEKENEVQNPNEEEVKVEEVKLEEVKVEDAVKVEEAVKVEPSAEIIGIPTVTKEENPGTEAEVVEVAVPEKEKPEMIVLDDINDDDAPGPDEIPTAEEKQFWQAVEENPNDFASWTYLLQVVEKNGKLKQIQKAFTSFLALYPYCYGYWKKYADQMKKLVTNEAAFQVFNDAVVAIPLSVDLWTYFIHFIAEWKEGDETEIRTIYQRAVEACGQEYRSDKIWEAYVEWEKQTDKFRVLKLYKQFLGCIIQRHQYHFDKFREWIFFTPVKDMVTMDDIKELLAKHKAEAERRRIETEKKIKEEEELARKLAAAAEEQRLMVEEERRAAEAIAAEKEREESRRRESEADDVEMEDEKEEEAVVAPMETTSDDQAPTDATTEEEAPAAPEEVPAPPEETPPAPEEEAVPVPEEAAAAVGEEETVIAGEPAPPGEENIVAEEPEEFAKVELEEPLPDSPDALTDRQEAGVREQILLDMAPIHEAILAELEEVIPFEEGIKRPYFHVKELERVQLKNWKNYLNLIIEKKDTRRTVVLFERCLIACAFYEGFWIKYVNFMADVDVDETSAIYRRACMTHLVKKPQIHLNWAAFEEKRGRLEVAREALDHIDTNLPGLIAVTLRRAGLERRSGNIQQGADILKTAVEESRSRDTREYWIMKYIAYIQFILGEVEKAREFLLQQIDVAQRDKRLYLKLLELESFPSAKAPNVDSIVKVFDQALASTLSLEDKAGFSHRRLTFLEEYGTDVEMIIAAYEDHTRNYKTVLEEKKRERENAAAQKKDFKTRDYNNTGYRNTTPSNYRANNNSGYRKDYNHNQGYGSYNNTGYGNMNNNYNMQQQQQHYQQWYSQYAQQQGQYGSYQQSGRGY